MTAEDIVALMIPATFLGMMLVEVLVRSGRPWPEIPWWRARGFGFFVMLMTLNAVLPSLVPPELAQYHLVDGSRLGIAGGVAVGYGVLSLATATLHRAYHRYPLLWRIHQLHHAPQRMDMAGAVVFTPLEVVNNVIVSFTIMVFVLGLDPLAAGIIGYIAVFYGLFQHLNVATPKWLGYLIQRPESHSVHHRRSFHAYNYSDFPIWDILWGTFRNPGEFHGEVGFERAESLRIGAMLIGKDVNQATLGPGARGRTEPGTNPA
jgi:sterol desaturase/sphingolipid hydroxylase (fatty acid hydroxylase superfamily)